MYPSFPIDVFSVEYLHSLAVSRDELDLFVFDRATPRLLVSYFGWEQYADDS